VIFRQKLKRRLVLSMPPLDTRTAACGARSLLSEGCIRYCAHRLRGAPLLSASVVFLRAAEGRWRLTGRATRARLLRCRLGRPRRRTRRCRQKRVSGVAAVTGSVTVQGRNDGQGRCPGQVGIWLERKGGRGGRPRAGRAAVSEVQRRQGRGRTDSSKARAAAISGRCRQKRR
jgi:hypothetical protein